QRFRLTILFPYTTLFRSARYLETRGYSLPPSRFFEFKNLIYFDFKSVDETYFVFLDKASGVTHIGNELVDDVDHGIFGLPIASRSEEHTSELQSRENIVC